MATMSKNAFGSKANIEAAKAAGTIDEYDILYLDTQEIGWIDKNGNTVMSTTRTQSPIEVNGVDGLGIGDGETIPAGTSVDDIVRMLVQKAIPATYAKPVVNLTNYGGQASGDVEVGTSIIPKLRATFTQNDAGDLSAISIKQGANEVVNGTATPLDYVGDPIIIGDETITFVASATYGDAPVKTNNLGQESKENWFVGDTIDSSVYSITGKRNLFYGTGVGSVPTITSDVVRDLTNTKLAPTQGYSFNVNVDVGQQYVVVAYPTDLRDVDNITYVEANDTNMASNFTKQTIDVADARGGEYGLKSYKVYTYEMAIPAAAGMTFKVTI